jgi:hypothetical protein
MEEQHSPVAEENGTIWEAFLWMPARRESRGKGGGKRTGGDCGGNQIEWWGLIRAKWEQQEWLHVTIFWIYFEDGLWCVTREGSQGWLQWSKVYLEHCSRELNTKLEKEPQINPRVENCHNQSKKSVDEFKGNRRTQLMKIMKKILSWLQYWVTKQGNDKCKICWKSLNCSSQKYPKDRDDRRRKKAIIKKKMANNFSELMKEVNWQAQKPSGSQTG